jgi:APA family basic amino acid/polyamine antiporter
MYAYSRMVFVMARDGLFPAKLAVIHKKNHTPHIAIIIGGIIVATITGLCPMDVMASLVSMTAMFSFVTVSIIMLVLRKKLPNAKRPFKCPAAKIVAPIAILLCSYLILTLFHKAGIYFLGWLVIGVVVYFVYSHRNSKYSEKEVISS